MPTNQTNANDNRFEVHSDEMQEIIGRVPHWLLRWGTVVIFGVILMLLFTSHSVRYPDILSAQALINSREQPQKIVWWITEPGVTYQTHVNDGQHVQVGDTLVTEMDATKNVKKAIKARVKGQTYLLKGIENNPKAVMLLIVPPASDYEVQLKLPGKGAGKVKVGQRVLIKLDAFPDREFGFLEGQITGIVPVSMDNHYRANVKMVRGLVTNTGNVLPAQPLLQGTAEVMLDDKRLFNRIFETIL